MAKSIHEQCQERKAQRQAEQKIIWEFEKYRTDPKIRRILNSAEIARRIDAEKLKWRKAWANGLKRKISEYRRSSGCHPLVIEQLRRFVDDMENEPATERLKTGFG